MKEPEMRERQGVEVERALLLKSFTSGAEASERLMGITLH